MRSDQARAARPESVDRKPAKVSHWIALLPLVLLVLTLTACTKTTGWERSRAAYCAATERESRELDRQLGTIAEQLDQLHGAERDDVIGECDRLHDELRELGASLKSVYAMANVLAAGRPDEQDIEAAGLSLDITSDALRYDPSMCRSQRYREAAAHVRSLKDALAQKFRESNTRCRAVGAESARP